MKLFHADCMDVLRSLPDGCADLTLTDPPYSITGLKWDIKLDLPAVFAELFRVTRERGAVVSFATEPFTSRVIMLNEKYYKYSWLWIKPYTTGIMNCNCRPLKKSEDITVFSKAAAGSAAKKENRMNYFPIMVKREKADYTVAKARRRKPCAIMSETTVHLPKVYTEKYPTNVLYFGRDKESFHPTQKPVALLEYLIKTYTREGDCVLDPFAGSASTAVACINTGRRFIGCEKDAEFFRIAVHRLESALLKQSPNLRESLEVASSV